MVSTKGGRAESQSRAASGPSIATSYDTPSDSTSTQTTPPAPEHLLSDSTSSTRTGKPDNGTAQQTLHRNNDDSLRLPGGRRFLRDPLLSNGPSRSSSQSPFRLPMPTISPGQLAFSALQHLPIPTIVLNDLKTVVLANEAMGRMLGISADHGSLDDAPSTQDRLRGQTLSQVGIDMLQEGRPVWVTWDVFLDSLVSELGTWAATEAEEPPKLTGDTTPTTTSLPSTPHRRQPSMARATQDAVVEVVVSKKDVNMPGFGGRSKSKENGSQLLAKMIISIWEIEENQTYFTLTFTNTQSGPSPHTATKKYVTKPSILEAADKKSIAHSNPSSVASSRDSSSPSFHSPGVVTMSSSPFPPMGPPSGSSQSTTPSVLQKMLLIKDALLDNTQVPIIAMWKDGSVAFPNSAARKLFHQPTGADPSTDGFGLLKYWDTWNEDFTERLEPHEYPIAVLCRTEAPFSSMRVGIYDEKGNKTIFECLGEAIRDDTTGEFLAGVVTAQDVTSMTQEITDIKERDEERLRLICNMMPHFVWTASPEGMHDFFNTRWYTYTGLTPENSMGLGWKNAFHPDDLANTLERWNHSLKTGAPYTTEYRCRNSKGEWRWYLGRAIAVRNKETDEIEKWFGTCTDVHESIERNLTAKRTRQQLLSVIAHAHVTIFTTDQQGRVTMLEGALLWNSQDDGKEDDVRWYMGENIYTVFNRLTEHLPAGERPAFLQPIDSILSGSSFDGSGSQDHELNNRWYRTRLLPMHGKIAKEGKTTSESCVDGVIGVIMDVTELRKNKQQANEKEQETRKAVANEAAAKEATRLKSQFLANMSHEIRTPITGVLGMAELLGGMELDEEQREYVENIHSSATSLLTVINDILDFSKVESGRLDIEEVQFSLSVIVKEVGRMLSFAVERKNLDFRSDIGDDIENDMVVIGDPGRVRQIITNLLTNSIKFTNQGFVKFSVTKERETADSVEIKFIIADTGIGIQEDVRKRLFQPFSQGDASTARRFGGTGLGLTICKNLLDLMHGRIILESTVGSGTTVTFWIAFNKPQTRRDTHLVDAGGIPNRLQTDLSLSCNSSEADGASLLQRQPSSRRKTPPSIEEALPRPERAKMHILVVEDNPVNQKIATRTIGRLGFQVTACWNGREALDYLIGTSKGQNPKPDIILMDVQMPVIDGYKCTHLLRHHLPYKNLVHDVPIVAMTASAIQGDREKCTKAGMDDYLSKPVTMSILEKMLIRWCINRRTIQPSPAPSECSELGEQCDNADIPHVGIEDQLFRSQENSSPLTPRPLTTNGQNELSPFDSPAAAELAPQVRRPDKDEEMSNKLQETKLIGAAGGPTGIRANSFQGHPPGGSALTEENMNKLKTENRHPPK